MTLQSYATLVRLTVYGLSRPIVCRLQSATRMLPSASLAFRTRVCIKIEIHEIHQNLRNPVSINRNPLSVTKST